MAPSNFKPSPSSKRFPPEPEEFSSLTPVADETSKSRTLKTTQTSQKHEREPHLNHLTRMISHAHTPFPVEGHKLARKARTGPKRIIGLRGECEKPLFSVRNEVAVEFQLRTRNCHRELSCDARSDVHFLASRPDTRCLVECCACLYGYYARTVCAVENAIGERVLVRKCTSAGKQCHQVNNLKAESELHYSTMPMVFQQRSGMGIGCFAVLCLLLLLACLSVCGVVCGAS